MEITGAAPPLLAMGAVPVTPITVAPVPIPSSLLLSLELMLPAATVVTAAMLMTGAAPPDELIGKVPVTPVTVAPVPIPSSFSLSAALIDPAAAVVLALMVTFGTVVGVPVMTTGAVPVTLVTVPEPPPVLVLTERSMVMVMPRPLLRVIGGFDDCTVTVVISECPMLYDE
jgi:hypothetical protein